jgi:hypothetical protein
MGADEARRRDEIHAINSVRSQVQKSAMPKCGRFRLRGQSDVLYIAVKDQETAI